MENKMFKKFKKCLTAFMAAAIAASAVGCNVGEETKYAMYEGDFNLKSGIYIYYQNDALSSAKSLASQQNESLNTDDTEALKKTIIENKNFLTWVNDKTLASCGEHIAVIRKFNELELSLSDEDTKAVKSYVDSIFEEEDNEYTQNGISKDSLKEILTNTYKATAIFEAYYGQDGIENVQESDLKEDYIKSHARVKYVKLDLLDSEGNALDDASKKEIKDMADDYLKQVKDTSGEKAMLQKFNDIKEDYDTYTEQKSAEAEAETATTAVQEQTTTTTTTTVTETEEGTTTTTDPYANENIIEKVTTDENTKEEDITYSPTKEVYDWAFNSSTKNDTPEIIETEDAIYVAVKLDIKERLTDDDLWSESIIDRFRWAEYSDDFQDKLDEWVKELNLLLNKKAADRYDPFAYKTAQTNSAN